ncbi:MAG TPA: biopolymer transporter ExbD [Puia sp.]|nr:biopolymer transporter ExbD [Puia sp.]
MAELDTSGSGHKKGRGGRRSKKLSTRVDLTPMVDLGFLLITFFIFTTTMTQPTAMRLILPKDVPDSIRNEVPKSAVITLIPAKNDLIYYYEGDDPTKMQTADYRSIRDIVLDKKRRSNPKWFEVILKPSKDASYKNIVDILDEMKIDAVPHYALVDITPEESSLALSLHENPSWRPSAD